MCRCANVQMCRLKTHKNQPLSYIRLKICSKKSLDTFAHLHTCTSAHLHIRIMKERYYSLDVFRGATVALMILVNNPGSWSNIFGPLKHAPWHGCTPTDLVIPFFLFAVGNAMAFVMPRWETDTTADRPVREKRRAPAQFRTLAAKSEGRGTGAVGSV